MICVLVGPPGSGKGTQASLMAADLGVPTFRQVSCCGPRSPPALHWGGKWRHFWRPASWFQRVAGAAVEQRLAAPEAAQGAILDGYPRTVPQARALDGRLARTAAA
ncbi:MAG TPA: nucleoside monophosphate kinase [Candidatus Dormibacteraeota bacterium]|nr:nucleoside monophosphate kinase [Candidatus Dormibacteraeota bacterium]